MFKIYYSSLKSLTRRTGQRSFSATNKNTTVDPRHSRLIILGAGFSGLVASSYIPKISNVKNFEIRVLDQQTNVSYTPGLDLVPFGLQTLEQLEKPIPQCINSAINIDFTSVKSINPKNNTVVTTDNREYTYDYLVLASGLTQNTSSVEGLDQALADRDDGVVSTSSAENILKYKRKLDSFMAGKVIIYNDERSKVYESALNQAFFVDTFLRNERGKGLRDMSDLQYTSSARTLLPNTKKSLQVQNLFQEKGINFDNFGLKLVSVDANNRRATFQDQTNNKTVTKDFDLLFVNPEHVLPEPLRGLAGTDGNLEINPETLIHEKYGNILALGHCTRTHKFIPSRRAILEQGIILSYNLKLLLEANKNGKRPERLVKFSGKTELPLFIEPRKCLELGIDPKLPEATKQASMFDYYKEVHVYPEIYFRLLSRGWWFNDTGFRVPSLSTL